MHPLHIDKLFSPRTIAVFGASERPESVGARVFENLISGSFKGQVYAVNPKHKRVHRKRCYPDIAGIGKPVDLAVIATPAHSVPEIVRQCGEAGIAAAIVLSAGFGEAGGQGHRYQELMLENARQYDIRILGPNCLGLIRPKTGINATFSNGDATPGGLALVSQSGALCTAILDWAQDHQVGFSAMVSLGDAADVDFGDILDFLAMDPQTRSILLYIEGISRAREFVSALRAAARLKPVIVVKAGRHLEGSRAIMSHTGALVGADDVFDAVLRRAGAIRAPDVDGLFSVAEVLSNGRKPSGNRLAIVTNAGGPGVLATDRAIELGLKIPELQPATMEQLDNALPAHWSHNNPVDVLGDANPERYRTAVGACVADNHVDGVLVILTPQAMTKPTATAESITELAAEASKPVLVCWMGGPLVEEGRTFFSSHAIPHFQTPETAVEAFSYLAAFHRNQQLLLQVPGPLSYHDSPDVEGARLIIEGVMADGRRTLSSTESKAVLSAFRIDVTNGMETRSANEALVAAESLGFPVAMKISSSDITHKSDVGGVRLNVNSPQSVRNIYGELTRSAAAASPNARINGVTVERMHISPHARELMVGVVQDPVFGPVISFGAGGTTVEVVRDRAVALPPLNRFIVGNLVESTRISRLLGAFRHMPPVRMQALETLLLRVSEMVCELPHITEMDLNPVIADENGAIAVDARIAVGNPSPSTDRYAHMAIYPYPSHLVSNWQLADGTNIIIRPIRPEDAEIERIFVNNLSDRSKYFRFMQTLQELSDAMLVRLTQIDYDRELALIAVTRVEGKEREIGVARYARNPDGESCEFALVIADDWQRRGLGSRIMASLMEAAKARGLSTMRGEILASNANMLSLVKSLGFKLRTSSDDPGIKEASRRL